MSKMEHQLVQHLEEKLAMAYSRKAALEQEIQHLAPTGIQSLPIELLVEIFEINLALGHMLLRDIRLVCPLWNQVASNTQNLWSYIRLTVPSNIAGVNRCTRYCTEAIDRSGEHPLSIYLEYRLFPRDRQILIETMGLIHYLGGFEAVQEWILDGILIPTTDCLRPEMYSLSTGVSGFKAIFERGWMSFPELLSTVVGGHQQHMSRWRSFELTLPDEFWGRPGSLPTVFPEGIKIYPSLEIFRLRRRIYGISGWAPSWNLPIVVVDVSKHQEKRLEEFALHDLNIFKFDISTLDPLRLHRLTIHGCYISTFRFILRCRNLEYLSIMRFDTAVSIEAAQTEPVLFTRLSTVRIIYHRELPESLFRVISAPFLRKLIVSSFYYPTNNSLDSFFNQNLLHSLEVLDLRWKEQCGKESRNIIVLKFVFSNAPTLETIIMDKESLDAFLCLIAQISDEGIEPRCLRRLLLADGRLNETGERAIVGSLGFSDGSSFISYCRSARKVYASVISAAH